MYDTWPAAKIEELQQSRRQDSLRISPSLQPSFQAGVAPHKGACSRDTGQHSLRVIELHKQSSSPLMCVSEGCCAEEVSRKMRTGGWPENRAVLG